MVAIRCKKVLTVAAVAVSALSSVALAKPHKDSCCPKGTVQCGYECLDYSVKETAKSMGMHCDPNAPPDAPCMDPETPPEGCCEKEAVCCDGECVEPLLLESGFFDDPSIVCGDASCCEVLGPAEGPMAGFPAEAPGPAEFAFEFEGEDICCGQDMFCCDGVCLDFEDAAFTQCPMEGIGCCVEEDKEDDAVEVDADVDASGDGAAFATSTAASTDPTPLPDPQPSPTPTPEASPATASSGGSTGGGGGGGGGGSFSASASAGDSASGGGGGGGSGEFALCIPSGSKTYGPTVAQREFPKQGSAVTITSSGTCSWEEYAGGFDGYPSPEIGDGHEKGMDMAIQQMWPGDHAKQTKFLQDMIAIAKPVDMDFPEDEARADNGERMNNIRKLNDACSQLVTISC